MWVYILQGLTLGLSAGAAPGPLQTFFFTQALRNGWKKTLPAAFAPLLSDGPIVAFVLIVLNVTPGWVLRVLQFCGGLFILYLARNAWIAFRHHQGELPEPVEGKIHGLRDATIMNLLNPNPYIFWSTILGPLTLNAWQQSPTNGLALVSAFYITMISIFMTLIILFSTARRAGGKFSKWLLGFSALVLTFFGLFQFYQALA